MDVEVVYSDTMTVLSFYAIFLIVVTLVSLAGMVIIRHVEAGWKASEIERINQRRQKQQRRQ